MRPGLGDAMRVLRDSFGSSVPAMRRSRESVRRLTSSVCTFSTVTLLELSPTMPSCNPKPDCPSRIGVRSMPQTVHLPGWSDLIHGCMESW